MKTINHVIKLTKKDLTNSRKKASREIELENQVGWNSILKVHRSKKNYTRKFKHNNKY